MTANKHTPGTPGPWVPVALDDGSWVIDNGFGYPVAVAQNVGREIGSRDTEEDARKLAAAPELLEILRKILPFVATQAIGCHGDKCREEWCFSCNGEEDAEAAAKRGSELFAEAHSMIAKATGDAA